MNLKFKNLLIISFILLTLSISLTAVSAVSAVSAVNDGVSISDLSNIKECSTLEVDESIGYLSESNTKNQTFDDIQKMIDDTKENGTVNLNGYYVSNGNFINLNKSLTINGNGAVLDGKNISQFFYINGNNIVIKNINFVNSSSGSINTFQGSNYWSGSNGVIDNCNFVNLTSVAIFGDMNKGLISNCNFVNCFNGAISGEMINSIISDSNFTKSSSTFGGGAIYCSGSNNTVDYCNFVNCFVNKTDLDENTYGGAILWSGNYGIISNCNFMNCKAIYGGAISFNYYGGNNCLLINSNFSNCSGNYGGAIYWAADNGSMAGCIFEGCSAKNGSMVYWNGSNGDVGNNIFYIKSTDKINNLFYGFSKDVLENNSNKFVSKISVSMTIKQSGKYYGAKSITVTLSKAIKDQNIVLKFNNGHTVTVTTNSKGVATYSLPFSPGTYSVTSKATLNYPYEFKSGSLKNITISKATATLNASKLSTTYNSSKYFQVKVIANKKPVANVKLSLKLTLGTKSKTASITTDSNGIAKYNTSKLSVGTYKVVITCLTSNENVTAKSKTSSIIISPKYKATITPSKLSTTYDSGQYFKIKVVANNKSLSNIKLKLKVYTSTKAKTVYVTTNSSGIAIYNASKLSIGTHKVEVSSAESTNYVSASLKTSSIVIKKATTIVTAPKVNNTYKGNETFNITVKNKASGNVIKGLKLSVTIYTNKTSKTYKVSTDSNGVAMINTKTLAKGTHKVQITSLNDYYTVSKSGNLIIIK